MAARIVAIDNIQDGYILAKDIILGNGTIVMPIGTALKRSYINRMKEIGITHVHIKILLNELVIDDATENKIQKQCMSIVRNTIDKYSYFGNIELESIAEVAENIIEDILTEPEVIYNVSQVRDISESTYSHCINVCALSVLTGIRMKLSNKRLHELAIGTLLHDIGIVYLPPDLLQMQYYSMTEPKKLELKKHVIIGYTAVENEKWLSQTAKEIILSHHERCDGSGYPMHKNGQHLKQEIKIAAVCDAFDSHVYGNYLPRMKVHQVLDYIVGCAGKEFDLEIVDAFISFVAAYPTGTFVRTNTDEIGIVLRQNQKMPTRPIIQLVKNAFGETYEMPIEKDLTKELTLFIIDTL